MPKRPCAIAVTSDNATILCADKFGDVFSLPLLPPEHPKDSTDEAATPTPAPSGKDFVPSATSLTVHSARNRMVLEMQKKQRNKAVEKALPPFEHTLLLGHVSMLTSIALVDVERRSYIFTADRDEHIRISRGIPQTHIIEGFCLGHTEFISTMCIPETRRDILISGGGDDELYVWEWQAGRLLSKADLKQHVEAVKRGRHTAEPDDVNEDEVTDTNKLVVRGVWHVQDASAPKDTIVVSCEGYVCNSTSPPFLY